MPRSACPSPSRRASLLLALAAVVSPWCHAQGSAAGPAWPTKPLRIIVGFPAGTSPDLTARAFSEPLAKALGQPSKGRVPGDSSVRGLGSQPEPAALKWQQVFVLVGVFAECRLNPAG